MGILVIILTIFLGISENQKLKLEEENENLKKELGNYYEDFKLTKLVIYGEDLIIYKEGKEFVNLKDKDIDYISMLLKCDVLEAGENKG